MADHVQRETPLLRTRTEELASGRAFSLRSLLLGIAALTVLLLAPASSDAASREARIACAEFDTALGEYGAYVFELRKKPTACTHYRGNHPCHCTESPLTQIKWKHWGSARSTATATWHYCGMGICVYRPARLRASRLKGACGTSTYTQLRMWLPRHRSRGHSYPPVREKFQLPACETVFDYI